MRYNPATDRAISIDEIAAQCKDAIMKANTPTPPCSYDDLEFSAAMNDIADLLFDERVCWEDDLLIAA